MYCPSCGFALTQEMKFCNRCGAQSIAVSETSKKRLDDYLDGLFWITVFGLGLILGGLALMKGLDLSQGIITAYIIVSSLAFGINFALSLREVLRMLRSPKATKEIAALRNLDTRELNPGTAGPLLDAAPSVTENTTRSFEPIYSKQKAE